MSNSVNFGNYFPRIEEIPVRTLFLKFEPNRTTFYYIRKSGYLSLYFQWLTHFSAPTTYLVFDKCLRHLESSRSYRKLTDSKCIHFVVSTLSICLLFFVYSIWSALLLLFSNILSIWGEYQCNWGIDTVVKNVCRRLIMIFFLTWFSYINLINRDTLLTIFKINYS